MIGVYPAEGEDINHHLVTVYKTDNTMFQYSYDANGNRFRKYDGIVYTNYVNGADGNTEAISQSNLPTTTYNLWGNDNIGKVIHNGSQLTRYYYLKDHLGSVRMTVDAAGVRQSWNDYYPFGLLMEGRNGVNGDADAKYKFTSKERDTETQYDYFGARYYDSRIGRWLSVDPMTSSKGNWSPYVYGFDNPPRFVDPDGATEKERNEAIQQANAIINRRLSYCQMDCAKYVKTIIQNVTIDNSNEKFPDLVAVGPGMDQWKNGVARIVSMSIPIDPKHAEPGNLLTFRTTRSDQMGPNGAYDHIGMILQVILDEYGNVDHYVVAMSNSKGPQVANVKPENDLIFPVTGAWKWDTPDQIYSVPGIEVTATSKSRAKVEIKGLVPQQEERGWEAEYGSPPF